MNIFQAFKLKALLIRFVQLSRADSDITGASSRATNLDLQDDESLSSTKERELCGGFGLDSGFAGSHFRIIVIPSYEDRGLPSILLKTSQSWWRR